MLLVYKDSFITVAYKIVNTEIKLISCIKREVTEYWNDERIPVSILLIVILILAEWVKCGHVPDILLLLELVSSKQSIAYNLKIKLIIWLNSDAQGFN